MKRLATDSFVKGSLFALFPKLLFHFFNGSKAFFFIIFQSIDEIIEILGYHLYRFSCTDCFPAYALRIDAFILIWFFKNLNQIERELLSKLVGKTTFSANFISAYMSNSEEAVANSESKTYWLFPFFSCPIVYRMNAPNEKGRIESRKGVTGETDV